MKLEDERTIPASRQSVWQALNDESLLMQCIPGCEALERVGENELAGRVTAKLGSIKATLKGNVELENVNPPHSYSLVGEGKGAAGFARGRADIALHEDGPETTRMSYSVETNVGGKLAQMGNRLIDQTARKYADQFFDCFAERVGGAAGAETAGAEAGEAGEAAGESAPAASRESADASPPAEPRKGLHPAVWAGLLVLAVLALLYLFA